MYQNPSEEELGQRWNDYSAYLAAKSSESSNSSRAASPVLATLPRDLLDNLKKLAITVVTTAEKKARNSSGGTSDASSDSGNAKSPGSPQLSAETIESCKALLHFSNASVSPPDRHQQLPQSNKPQDIHNWLMNQDAELLDRLAPPKAPTPTTPKRYEAYSTDFNPWMDEKTRKDDYSTSQPGLNRYNPNANLFELFNPVHGPAPASATVAPPRTPWPTSLPHEEESGLTPAFDKNGYNIDLDYIDRKIMTRTDRDNMHSQKPQRLPTLAELSHLDRNDHMVNQARSLRLMNDCMDPSNPNYDPKYQRMAHDILAKDEYLCRFCFKNGEKDVTYKSHNIKDKSGRTTCPILYIYVCPMCGATGFEAHTKKYCKKNPGGEESPMTAFRTGRTSTGKRRPITGATSAYGPGPSFAQGYVNPNVLRHQHGQLVGVNYSQYQSLLQQANATLMSQNHQNQNRMVSAAQNQLTLQQARVVDAMRNIPPPNFPVSSNFSSAGGASGYSVGGASGYGGSSYSVGGASGYPVGASNYSAGVHSAFKSTPPPTPAYGNAGYGPIPQTAFSQSSTSSVSPSRYSTTSSSSIVSSQRSPLQSAFAPSAPAPLVPGSSQSAVCRPLGPKSQASASLAAPRPLEKPADAEAIMHMTQNMNQMVENLLE